MDHAHGVDRVGVEHGLLFEGVPPGGDVLLHGLAPARARAAVEPRQERGEGRLRVADEVDLGGVAHPDQGAVAVDLDGPGLPELGQELAVGHVGADDEERVAVAHELVGGPGAEQADRAGDVGQVVGQDVLAEQGLGDARAGGLGDALELFDGAAGALAGEDGDLLAGVEDLGGAVEVALVGGDAGVLVGRLGGGHVLELVLGRAVGLLLDVGGDDDGGGRAAGLGGAEGPVEGDGQLLGDVDLGEVLGGDVLEQRLEVDLLLVAAAHGAAGGLADDGDDGHVVEFGVVEPVEQVDRAGPGGGGADADAPGELGVAHGLEGGHLLVAALDEPRLVVGLAEGGDDAVDAVAGVAEYLFDAPFAESPEDVVADCRGHGGPPRIGAACGRGGYPPGGALNPRAVRRAGRPPSRGARRRGLSRP